MADGTSSFTKRSCVAVAEILYTLYRLYKRLYKRTREKGRERGNGPEGKRRVRMGGEWGVGTIVRSVRTDRVGGEARLEGH